MAKFWTEGFLEAGPSPYHEEFTEELPSMVQYFGYRLVLGLSQEYGVNMYFKKRFAVSFISRWGGVLTNYSSFNTFGFEQEFAPSKVKYGIGYTYGMELLPEWDEADADGYFNYQAVETYLSYNVYSHYWVSVNYDWITNSYNDWRPNIHLQNLTFGISYR
ncbi:MAG: hypothetical protein EP346_05670 [Bacteroidetes bacterium]|nr:MAG: hypothetical protein EP346_05670 [Bacteroidota bacterium]